MSETVKIPISKIMPNEDQPRQRFKVGSIEELADSMKALGQHTPVKVRQLSSDEKNAYLRSELEWQKLGHSLPKETIGERGFEYMLIGGHRRREAALLAGFEALDCIVLDIKAEETHLASLMDNNQEEMDWWDWDLAIEAEHKAFPQMTQRELAKRLGVSKSKVNNALVLTKMLDHIDRDTINMNLDPSCDSNGNLFRRPGQKYDTEEALVQLLDKSAAKYMITERILLALTPVTDTNYICEFLSTIIDNQMTEIEVKRLVKWHLDGNELSDFEHQKASKAKNQEIDPMAEAWKGLGPNIKVKHKGGEDYEIHLTVTGGQKALETAKAAQKNFQSGILQKLLNPT